MELGQNHKQNEGEDDEKALNSLYTFYKYLGVFTASLFKGILVEKFSIENVFLIASVFPTLLIIAGFVFYEKQIIKKSQLFLGQEATVQKMLFAIVKEQKKQEQMQF